jgi:hypothetical protein
MKVGNSVSKEGLTEYFYKVEIYNNTNKPICIPVSLSFGVEIDCEDTVEVVNIYSASDTALFFSLCYTKSEFEGSKTRYSASPMIINPQTYFSTNIRFVNNRSKKMYLVLKYSNDKNIDYKEIRASFESKPQYEWMDTLNFYDKKFQIK